MVIQPASATRFTIVLLVSIGTETLDERWASRTFRFSTNLGRSSEDDRRKWFSPRARDAALAGWWCQAPSTRL